MKTISQIIFDHYQGAAGETSKGWDKHLAEPIAQYLAAVGESIDSEVAKSLRDVSQSNDVFKDLAHNRQYIVRHLENNRLRADMVPFLIKYAPHSEDLLHEVLGAFGILPVQADSSSANDLGLDSFLAMGRFTEHSGGLTQLFARMVASNGGLGPEDKPHVPALIRMADKAISWANNIKFQAQNILDQ